MDKAERSTAPNRTPKDAELIHFPECHRALPSVRGNERTGGMDGAVDIERNLCPVQAHIVRAQGSRWATGNGTNVPLNWLYKLAHLFGVANLSTIVLKPPTGHFLPGGQLQYEELRNSLTVLQPDLSTCINVHKISLECALKSIPHFIEQRRSQIVFTLHQPARQCRVAITEETPAGKGNQTWQQSASERAWGKEREG